MFTHELEMHAGKELRALRIFFIFEEIERYAACATGKRFSHNEFS